MQKAFIIGEEHRAFVYREAGKLHRAFRTKMARSYLKNSKGGFVKHRPAKYSFCIKQDDWDKFVAQRMTAKFQVILLSLGYGFLKFCMIIVLVIVLWDAFFIINAES